MFCSKCNQYLICHHSMDATDVSHNVNPNTYIISYFICPRCETHYIEEISIDSKIIYQGELLTESYN